MIRRSIQTGKQGWGSGAPYTSRARERTRRELSARAKEKGTLFVEKLFVGTSEAGSDPCLAQDIRSVARAGCHPVSAICGVIRYDLNAVKAASRSATSSRRARTSSCASREPLRIAKSGSSGLCFMNRRPEVKLARGARHSPAMHQQPDSKTSAATESLKELYALLGRAVFLVIPHGKKVIETPKWDQIGFQTQTPAYQRTLVNARARGGNLAVRLGPPSDGLRGSTSTASSASKSFSSSTHDCARRSGFSGEALSSFASLLVRPFREATQMKMEQKTPSMF